MEAAYFIKIQGGGRRCRTGVVLQSGADWSPERNHNPGLRTEIILKAPDRTRTHNSGLRTGVRSYGTTPDSGLQSGVMMTLDTGLESGVGLENSSS